MSSFPCSSCFKKGVCWNKSPGQVQGLKYARLLSPYEQEWQVSPVLELIPGKGPSCKSNWVVDRNSEINPQKVSESRFMGVAKIPFFLKELRTTKWYAVTGKCFRLSTFKYTSQATNISLERYDNYPYHLYGSGKFAKKVNVFICMQKQSLQPYPLQKYTISLLRLE